VRLARARHRVYTGRLAARPDYLRMTAEETILFVVSMQNKEHIYALASTAFHFVVALMHVVEHIQKNCGVIQIAVG